MTGYLRSDGRKGIRNIVVVVYLVECAHHVAREMYFPYREEGVHLLGFPGCFPNAYAHRMLRQLCTHPNVGAALLVSLGCEGFDRYRLRDHIKASGRGVETVVIQKAGGTARALAAGTAWIEATLPTLAATPTVPMTTSDLVVGTVCGGSDGTSGLTANPAIGKAFDRLVRDGAACLFGENAEMIGCETFMASRGSRLSWEPRSFAQSARPHAPTTHSDTAASRRAMPKAASRRRKKSRSAPIRKAAARRSPASSSPLWCRLAAGST